MRYAIFSDIHGNWEALETAVEHAQKNSVRSYAVLGDSVGYGANPNECMEWVAKNAGINLLGNHEVAVSDREIRKGFNAYAHEAIIWTEGRLDRSFKDRILKLGYRHEIEGVTFVHGSPDFPEEFRYLNRYEDARESFAHFKTRICFAGHTHRPGCICELEKSARGLPPGVLKLDARERYILNPGSIGQPRDGDPRLSYGIYDGQQQSFEIFRLEYNNTKAAEKIRKAGLPRFLADRLL